MRATVLHLSGGVGRDRRSARPRAEPTAPAVPSDGRPVGRAWINGREVGGTADRLVHLMVAHD